ncbi:hypothetical protein [Pedobacter agri]|uniref:hypothetical protein n=1 Tax=Pedobacter agri TaxID=454586 RepID=UPI00292EC5F2|nr:hypothetical protein [Pedobacter agri]
MAKTVSSKSRIQLIHDLTDVNDSSGSKLQVLLNQIRNSDTSGEGTYLFKTDMPFSMEEDIRKNKLLREFSKEIPAETQNEQYVIRRETPFASLTNITLPDVLANSAPALGGLGAIAAPQKTLGPFTGNGGKLIWYDFFAYEKLIAVYLAGEDKPIMLIPLRINVRVRPTSSYTLSKGSIWIRADLFASAAGNTKYTGFKIKSGKISFNRTVSGLGGSMKLGADISFDMELNLDNEFENKGEGIYGLDCRNSAVYLPNILALAYIGKKITIKRFEDLSWKLYGDSRVFKQTPRLVTFNSTFDKLFIPLQTAKDNFQPLAIESEFFRMEGEAPVRACNWSLSLNELDVTKPFSIRNNGAIAVDCRKGLTASWQGIDPSKPLHLLSPYIFVEQGLFIFHELNADFKSIEEEYKLWNRSDNPEIKTGMRLSFNRKKKFDYMCLGEGTEGIVVSADISINADKPLQADGEPVAHRTKDSIYVKYISAESAQVMVIDQDMLYEHSENGDVEENLLSKQKFKELKKEDNRYRFVLENAYLICTPPATLVLRGNWNKINEITEGNLTVLYGLTDLIPMLAHPYTSEILHDPRSSHRGLNDVAAYNRSLSGRITSIASWKQNDSAMAQVAIDFKLSYNPQEIIPSVIQSSKISYESSINPYDAAPISDRGKPIRSSQTFRAPRVFSLLDLSTHDDLLGISMSFNQVRHIAEGYAKVNQVSEQVVTIQQMNLRSPMAVLNGYTLPHISWEPLKNETPPRVSGDPQAGFLAYSDQGPATVFTQHDSQVINIDPARYMQRFKVNLKSEEFSQKEPPARNPLSKNDFLHSSVLFGLPNGKVSIAYLVPFDESIAMMNNSHLDFIQPDFSHKKLQLKGGMQFRIAARKSSLPEKYGPELSGITLQLHNLIDENGQEISQSVLGSSVHAIFRENFSLQIKDTGVPITHIDFSGYGASTYSNWLNPVGKYATVAQVKFDVLRGRVAHDVVQVATMVYPFGIALVRTITFYRRNNAVIYREDSGWVAKSEGIFDFSFEGRISEDESITFANPYSIHPGVVQGLHNVHNIKEIEGSEITFSYHPQKGDYYKQGKFIHVQGDGPSDVVEAKFVAITFDADVHLDRDGKGNTLLVTGKQFKGYVQLSPEGVPVPKQIFQQLLLQNQNSLGGSVDCSLNLGGGTQRMQVNRVDVSASYQNGAASDVVFIAAAKGSVQLPGNGSWGVVEADNVTGEVSPVKNKQSLPLIRVGERNRSDGSYNLIPTSKLSQITFHDALLNPGSFPKRFAYLQNTGTQKMLLGNPRYHADQITELISNPPLLADSFRLLKSKGPFPNLENAITLENVTDSITGLIPEGMVKEIINFKLPDDFTYDIIGEKNAPFRLYIKYKSDYKNDYKDKTEPEKSDNTVINYLTDSAAGGDKWKSDLGNISIVVDLASFKSLMTISGNFKANPSISASIDAGKGPQLKLAKELQAVYDILVILDSLDPSSPADAVKKGLQVAMSNAADSWDYKFKASKEIPFVKFPFDPINYNAPTTPLKLDAYFKIGCYFNQPIKIPKTIDQVMPSAGAFLEFGADLRVMCVSLAAATIYAIGRAEVGLIADEKSPPTLYFKFGFGVELCVGLPVIGSVSVLYMVGVDMPLNVNDLTVGAFIYFRGRVEIFGGIVTVSINIEAAGKIYKQFDGGPTNCIAMCTFALDISIFWVIDINFTETWEESRQIA